MATTRRQSHSTVNQQTAATTVHTTTAAQHSIQQATATHSLVSPLLLSSTPPHTDSCSVCGHAIAQHYSISSTSSIHSLITPNLVQQEYLMDCVLCGRAADTSHTLNDVAAQRAAHVVTQAHMSHGISSAMSQQQHATMRQLIGRMEIVSVAVHTTGPSTGGQPVDVEDDEWS